MQGRMTGMNLSQSSYSMENQRTTASAVKILVCKCNQKFSPVFELLLSSINFHIRHSQWNFLKSRFPNHISDFVIHTITTFFFWYTFNIIFHGSFWQCRFGRQKNPFIGVLQKSCPEGIFRTCKACKMEHVLKICNGL